MSDHRTGSRQEQRVLQEIESLSAVRQLDPAGAVKSVPSLLQRARSCPTLETKALALVTAGSVYRGVGRLVDAKKAYRLAALLASSKEVQEDLDHCNLSEKLLVGWAYLKFDEGAKEAAVDFLEEFIDSRKRSGSFATVARARVDLGTLLNRKFEFTRAAAEFSQALPLLRGTKNRRYRQAASGNLFQSLAWLGAGCAQSELDRLEIEFMNLLDLQQESHRFKASHLQAIRRWRWNGDAAGAEKKLEELVARLDASGRGFQAAEMLLDLETLRFADPIGTSGKSCLANDGDQNVLRRIFASLGYSGHAIVAAELAKQKPERARQVILETVKIRCAGLAGNVSQPRRERLNHQARCAQLP